MEYGRRMISLVFIFKSIGIRIIINIHMRIQHTKYFRFSSFRYIILSPSLLLSLFSGTRFLVIT